MLQLLGSEMKPRMGLVLLEKKKNMILLCLHYVKLSVQTSTAGKEYHVLTFFIPGCAGRSKSEMGITVWCDWNSQVDWNMGAAAELDNLFLL